MHACMQDPSPSPQDIKEAALLRFMSTPHPMETLSLAASYGPMGAIMRYHWIGNYTQALAALVPS